MEYIIRNIYNQHLVNFDGDYVRINSGIDVGWIYTENNITTITLFSEHYEVTKNNDDVIDIKRG